VTPTEQPLLIDWIMPMETLADDTAHYGRQDTLGVAPEFMAS